MKAPMYTGLSAMAQYWKRRAMSAEGQLKAVTCPSCAWHFQPAAALELASPDGKGEQFDSTPARRSKVVALWEAFKDGFSPIRKQEREAFAALDRLAERYCQNAAYWRGRAEASEAALAAKERK